MSLTNRFGDFEITDPRAMRALAHPVRLAALTYLQRHGPSTATQLSPVVGATPSVTSWHLRHLADFGLVTDWDGGTDARQRWWQASAKGFRVAMPADEEGRSDFEALQAEMFSSDLQQAADWLAETSPSLDATWAARSGASNTSLLVTPEEADILGEQLEALLAPLLASTREPIAGAARVRFIRFMLAQPDESR